MSNAPQQVAPEPYLSAALYLLQKVALFIRNSADQISAENLSDLGDAIHVIPETLTRYGPKFDEQMIRELFLKPYDQKWSNSETRTAFSLIETLDEGIEETRKRLNLDI